MLLFDVWQILKPESQNRLLSGWLFSHRSFFCRESSFLSLPTWSNNCCLILTQKLQCYLFWLFLSVAAGASRGENQLNEYSQGRFIHTGSHPWFSQLPGSYLPRSRFSSSWKQQTKCHQLLGWALLRMYVLFKHLLGCIAEFVFLPQIWEEVTTHWKLSVQLSK